MDYLGRIIALGKTEQDKLVGIYRVSSRSFPNREAIKEGNTVSIRLKKKYEKNSNNPYISYDCLTILGEKVIISNGIHTDYIKQKILNNYKPKDALISILSAMDYEYDQLNTPRIAGIICLESKTFSLGIIRDDGLEVKSFSPQKGEIYYIATYKHNSISDKFKFSNFCVKNSTEACEYILNKNPFKKFSYPILSASAFQNGKSFELNIINL